MFAETIVGHLFDDYFRQAQSDCASDNAEIEVPNGIEPWLDMLPIGDDEDSLESLVIR